MVEIMVPAGAYGKINGWSFFARAGEWTPVHRIVAIGLRALGFSLSVRWRR